SLHSGQYRGRSRTGKHRGLRPVTPHRAGLAQRIRNTSVIGGLCGIAERPFHREGHESVRSTWKDASIAHSILAAKGRVALMPRSIRHSSLAIRYSLFATRYSLGFSEHVI